MASSLRVALITWGTEGDVRPFFALARALSLRGHRVRVHYVNVEGRTFEALAQACGVDASPIATEYFEANREVLRRASEQSLRFATPAQQFELIIKDLMDPIADELLARSLEAAQESDVVVGHVLAHPIATAAEKAGRPYVSVALQPLHRSKRYAPAGAPNMGRLFNPLLWKLADHVMRSALNPRIAAQRTALAMPQGAGFDPCRVSDAARACVAVAPSLFARPDDWAAGLEVTGVLSLPEATEPWTPEPALGEFLAAGPPVFASFGSMFTLSEELTRTAVEAFAGAMELADARAVIQCPASVSATAPKHPRVCYIERAPHGQLFRRCSMIVHHGGAGTTHSALLAGRPSVVVPHAADQFFWGDLLYARGAGASPLRRPKLTAKSLAERVRWVRERPSLTERAAELGAELAREDGANVTADFVERAATSGRAAAP